jgi:aminopeptidase 2
MISKYLGEDVFMAGIRRYIKNHSYGNTQTSDLWTALSEESGKDISHLASIWTKKVGYPVLTVTEPSPGKVHIKQNRFLTTGDVKPEEDETLYWILLALKTLDKNGRPVINEELTTTERETTIHIPEDGVYKLNAGCSGIYRVAYTPERLEKLGSLPRTNPGFLSIEDRAGLVADTAALCASGYTKTTGLLNLVSGWKDESEFVYLPDLSLFFFLFGFSFGTVVMVVCGMKSLHD